MPARRWLTRYCGPTATAANCELTTEPKALADTITMVPPISYAIRDFRISECGSALPVCTGDILPAPPIAATCARIEAGPLHTCTYVTLPTESHLACHANHAADARVHRTTTALAQRTRRAHAQTYLPRLSSDFKSLPYAK